MSSIAAAKKRRSNVPISPTNVQPPPATGLTLQQVISLIDKRLVTLETASQATFEPAQVTSEYVDEFNARFVLLAEEIANIKNVVLNLQSYTMDVNKTLMDERNKFFNALMEERKQTAEFSFSQPSPELDSEPEPEPEPVEPVENITAVLEE